ncbi:MAG: hypothetical protein O7E52_04625 [Candidatus Poribacteria bacterium]|nr:hypothetical protein [Candidatus Poribacteria bacterium]
MDSKTKHSISPTQSPQPQIRWAVIWLGLGLILVNNYWVFAMLRWEQGLPTTMSLFFNVIFIFTILVVLNYGFTRFAPHLALTQGELLTLYAMLSVASAIGGHDLFQVVVTNIAVVGWMSTDENEWATLFHRFLPDWLALTNKHSITPYFVGESSLYITENLRLWWRPVFAWSGFIIVLLFTTFFINVILRKQWIEAERLSYPTIELPHQMTTTGFFRNRLIWAGLILAGGMDLVNGLHFLYPVVPGLGGEFFDVHPFFTTKPWNAIGWTPIVVFPFAIGMAYFIPLDLSFTFWFFYIFWKFEMILGSILGFQQIPGFPFIFDQSFGVCVGVLILTLWGARLHLRNVLAGAWRGEKASESNEPISYRTAVLGLIVGFLLLVGFWGMAGMSLWVAALVFVIHFTTVTVITRIRAELGPPIHDLRAMGPDVLLPKMFGMRQLGARNLSLFSLVYCFNRAYRGNAMPHQLEGLKLAERAGVSSRRVGFAILLTVVLSPLASFWFSLHIGYKSGAWEVWYGSIFRRTQSWLTNPMPVDVLAILSMIFGAIFTFFLTAVRLRFVWFPLYPVGYAISGTWAVNFFWFSVFISYVIKWCILRFGGLRAFHRAAPFFLGLILGEFFVGSVWALIGVLLEKPMYRFIW